MVEILVTVGGAAGIAFTYWFFLAGERRDDGHHDH
jgi:hypothetical protein